MSPPKFFLKSSALWLAIVACFVRTPCEVVAVEIEDALRRINAIGDAGEGFESAVGAAVELRKLNSRELPQLLTAARDASPVATNWLRGIAGDIFRKADEPPVDSLADFVADKSNAPAGRAIALDLIERSDPQRALVLVRDGLEDPSLLIREKAVADAIETAQSWKAKNRAKAIEVYRRTLTAARHPKQLTDIISALKALDQPVTIAEAFSMIGSWHVIGPFDNVNGVGFDRMYQPEADFLDDGTVDLQQSCDGKNGTVRWQLVTTDSEDGMVDLAATYDKEKGAVAYAYLELNAPRPLDAQLRLGCPNANRAWLNGKEVMANEVYHSGSMIDQYMADVTLRKGINRVLLKICQNEQTDSWAQEWEFQFRITDRTGKGLDL